MDVLALPDLADDHPLDAALPRAFERDGHVLVRGLASGEEIAAYRPVIGEVVEQVSRRHGSQGRIDDYSKLFMQVTNIWCHSEAARRIVCSRRFAAVAARLLGVPSVRLYHDQALFKPREGERTPWHQDRYYWPLDTDRTVTMWLALVDIPKECGPMVFASGSHRGGDFGDVSISDETDRRLAALIRERGWPVVSAPLGAGDATFHSGGTLHSAGPNLCSYAREVLTVIYYATGTRVAQPANENQRVDLEVFLPGVRAGEEAVSYLNPLLYDATAS